MGKNSGEKQAEICTTAPKKTAGDDVHALARAASLLYRMLEELPLSFSRW